MVKTLQLLHLVIGWNLEVSFGWLYTLRNLQVKIIKNEK